MEKKTKKNKVKSTAECKNQIICDERSNCDDLNQTDDFTGGWTPFKRAASKAVDKESKKNHSKITMKKAKLLTSKKGSSFEESTLKMDSSKTISDNEEVMEKICEICKCPITADKHSLHVINCLKSKYAYSRNTNAVPEKGNVDIICQICQSNISSLSVNERNAHVNTCIDNSSCDDGEEEEKKMMENNKENCKFCYKSISHLTAVQKITHKNQCVDQHVYEKELEEKVAMAREKARNKVLDCPICGQSFKTQISRRTHLKKCAVKYNISATVLLEKVKQQEEEHQKSIADGAFPLDIDEVGNQKKKKTNPRKKKSSASSVPGSVSTNNAVEHHSTRKFEEDTQIALALSNSIHDSRTVGASNSVETDQQMSKDAFSILMTPKAQEKGHGRRKKKLKVCLEKLPLLIQSEAETNIKLEKKVATVLLSQGDDNALLLTPQFRNSLVAEKYAMPIKQRTGTRFITFWERTVMENITNTQYREVYYVPVLMPPIVFCEVKAGSKLKHMSCIAGWQSTDKSICEEVKPKMQKQEGKTVSFLNDTAMVASTQTAVMLAELAQDHGTSIWLQDKTCLLNQTGFIEEPCKSDENRIVTAEQEEQTITDFGNMVDNSSCSDLLICVKEDKQIVAHQFVLAARCNKMLQSIADRHLKLTEFSYATVLSLMRYLYAGNCNFEPNVVVEMKQLALRFDLSDLVSICNCIIEKADLDSASSIKDETDYYNQDKTLQNILKAAWGSDSEDDSSQSSNEKSKSSSTNNKKTDIDDYDLDDLYEFMASQRTKSKEMKLSLVDEYEMKVSDCSMEVFNDENSEIDHEYNQNSFKFNRTVCINSIDKLKNMSDSEVLEKLKPSDQKQNIMELTHIDTEIGSDSESIMSGCSEAESGIIEIGQSDSEDVKVTAELGNRDTKENIPMAGSLVNDINSVCDKKKLREDTMSQSSDSGKICGKSHQFSQNTNLSQKYNYVENIVMTAKESSSDEQDAFNSLSQKSKLSDKGIVACLSQKSDMSLNSISVLDSKVNEDEIIALLDECSSFTSTQSSNKQLHTKGNGENNTDNKKDQIDLSLPSASSLHRKSPFKDDVSSDNSLFDESCAELFDSVSEGHLSHLRTPTGIKNSWHTINSVNSFSHSIECQNLSVLSTPSPVFQSQEEICKTRSSAPYKAKQNLNSSFMNVNTINVLDTCEDGQSDNCSQKKRKIYELGNDSNVIPSRKCRKKSNNPKINVSCTVEKETGELNVINPDKSAESPEFGKNSKSQTFSTPALYHKKNKDRCVDLTMKPGFNLSGIENPQYKVHDMSLSSNDSSPVQVKIHDAEDSIQDAEAFPMTSNPDSCVWEDFENDGFEENFVCSGTLPEKQDNSPQEQSIIADNSEMEVEKKNRTKDHLVDLVDLVNTTNRSYKRDKHIGAERKTCLVASNQINGIAQPSIEPELQRTSSEILPMQVNSKLNQSLFQNENTISQHEISMYDPPTDISMNNSTLADQSSMWDNSDTVQSNASEIMIPTITPCVAKKKAGKTPSKWVPPSPFTPMAGYDTMATPKLQQQVKRFGVRAMPKKKMVHLLKNIYQESHAYETDPEFDTEAIKAIRTELPEKESTHASENTKKNKGKVKGKKAETVKTSGPTTGKGKASGSTTGKGKAVRKRKEPEKDVVHGSSSEDESGSNEDLAEEINLDSSQEFKSSKRDTESKRKELWDIIQADEELMLKILHYETIELEEFQKMLKTKGVKQIGTKIILEFLDDKAIPFSNKLSFGKKNSRKKKKITKE